MPRKPKKSIMVVDPKKPGAFVPMKSEGSVHTINPFDAVGQSDFASDVDGLFKSIVKPKRKRKPKS